METRKQLRGNCQCCGRLHAVMATGRISKHGYTVANGWFQGVCTGQHYAPMQKSRTATDEIVALVRTDCDELEQLANAYKVGIAHPARIDKSHHKQRRGEDKTMAWEEADKWEQEGGIKSAIYRLENKVRAGRDFATMLEKLVNERHGTPLVEVKVEAAKAPIERGEKRKALSGSILTVVRVDGGRVYWKDERGFGSWTGQAAWRKREIVE